jgi:ABC-type nitrate/sulfonate/bicarbonate transport system permease component
MNLFSKYILPVISFLVLLILWQTGVGIFQIPNWLLPAPTIIFNELWRSRELIVIHTTQTLIETIIGLVIAVIFGVGIALLMESISFFKNLLKPFLVLSQTIPFIVLAPLLIIWLGYGVLPKIVVIVLACFFPIVINMLDGFQAVDAGMVKLLQSMKAGKKQIFHYVILPASMPYFFSGLRIAGTYAVGIAVVSEWLGAEKGLGIMLLRAAKSFQTEEVFATITVISLLSLFVVGIIEIIARRSIPWFYVKKGVA